MGTKSSKPAPPPPPPQCNLLSIPVPNGRRDYYWVDSTGRNGGVQTDRGYVMCLKSCRPDDTPEVGTNGKLTGKMIYSVDITRTNGLTNSKKGESYSPVVYKPCGQAPCGVVPMPASTGCIP